MTSIIYTFPWYARAIDQIVGGRGAGGRGAGGRGAGGRGVGGRGGAFHFKQSSMVPDIFAVIFCIYNRCIGGILK